MSPADIVTSSSGKVSVPTTAHGSRGRTVARATQVAQDPLTSAYRPRILRANGRASNPSRSSRPLSPPTPSAEVADLAGDTGVSPAESPPRRSSGVGGYHRLALARRSDPAGRRLIARPARQRFQSPSRCGFELPLRARALGPGTHGARDGYGPGPVQTAVTRQRRRAYRLLRSPAGPTCTEALPCPSCAPRSPPSCSWPLQGPLAEPAADASGRSALHWLRRGWYAEDAVGMARALRLELVEATTRAGHRRRHGESVQRWGRRPRQRDPPRSARAPADRRRRT